VEGLVLVVFLLVPEESNQICVLALGSGVPLPRPHQALLGRGVPSLCPQSPSPQGTPDPKKAPPESWYAPSVPTVCHPPGHQCAVPPL